MKKLLKNGIGKIKNLIEKDEREQAKDYVDNALEKFKSYYHNFNETFKKEFKKCQKGNLDDNNRDFLWLFCLDILPYDKPSSWKHVINELRSDYNELKKGIITNEISNFIMLNDEKGGNKYNEFKEKINKEDFELLDLIKIDIERTYQDIELFKRENIKQIMAYVLFIYSKKFPLLGYKQGMNDICAIFLYVLYKQCKLNTNFTENEYCFLFYVFHSNNEFLENDLYLMYSSFMNKGIGEFYLYSKYKKSELSAIPLEKKILLSKEEIDNIDDAQIKKRIYHIFYRHLQKFDVQFYNEMINKVEPELFLFKWYLCFLTREFPINKVIHLWDLIFAYDFIEYRFIKTGYNKEYHFRFIDSIALSMILCCKDDLMKLKNENESKFLDLLMHYPDKIKVEQILKEAFKIDSIINPDKIFDLKKEYNYYDFDIYSPNDTDDF